MKQNEREEEIHHNTLILLRKYRRVRWALEVAAQQAAGELCGETGIVEQFLNAASIAGADISHTRLEGRARSLERSRMMLKLIDRAAAFLKTHHPKGQIYYKLIYRNFLSPQPETQQEILTHLEEEGIAFSETTMRKYRNDAVKIIGEILWGYDDRESAKIVEELEQAEY